MLDIKEVETNGVFLRNLSCTLIIAADNINFRMSQYCIQKIPCMGCTEREMKRARDKAKWIEKFIMFDKDGHVTRDNTRKRAHVTLKCCRGRNYLIQNNIQIGNKQSWQWKPDVEYCFFFLFRFTRVTRNLRCALSLFRIAFTACNCLFDNGNYTFIIRSVRFGSIALRFRTNLLNYAFRFNSGVTF